MPSLPDVEPDEVPRERSCEEKRLSRLAAEAFEHALIAHKLMLENLRQFAQKQEMLVNKLLAELELGGTDSDAWLQDGCIRSCANDRSDGLRNWDDALVRASTDSRISKLQFRTAEQSFDGIWVDAKGIFNDGHPVCINRKTFQLTDADSPQFSIRERPENTYELVMIDTSQKEHSFAIHFGQEANTIVVRGDAGEQWILHAEGKSHASSFNYTSGTQVSSKWVSKATGVTQISSQVDCENGAQLNLTSSEKEGYASSQYVPSFAGRSSQNSDHSVINKAAQLLGIHRHCESERDVSATSRSFIRYKSWWRKLLEQANTPADKQSIVGRFVRSKVFETIAVIVITLNAGFIAFHADYERQNLGSVLSYASSVDWVFFIFYTVELVLRIFVYRIYFFFGKDASWNLFDFLLVCSALQDRLGSTLDMGGGQNMSFLRMMRLLKMLKILRMIRLMRMFRELRLIMNSIMGSIKSMFWSMIMILVVLFMFGLLFLQATTDYLNGDEGDIKPSTRDDIDEFWGSVPDAILSLYMASMSGEDWRKIASPLWECGWAFYGAFLLYICFYFCVISNTLTSLFVESTMMNADRDQQQIIQAELEQKDAYVKMLKGWYEKIDKDHSGDISLDEVVGSLEAPEMLAFASRMGIETLDVKQFFSVLSCNGRRAVDLETFVVGCIKLKGMAKSMDLMDLIYAHRQATSDQHQFATFATQQFLKVNEHLDVVMLRLAETDARINDNMKLQARILRRNDSRVSKTSRVSGLTDRTSDTFFVGQSLSSASMLVHEEAAGDSDPE